MAFLWEVVEVPGYLLSERRTDLARLLVLVTHGVLKPSFSAYGYTLAWDLPSRTLTLRGPETARDGLDALVECIANPELHDMYPELASITARMLPDGTATCSFAALAT